MKRVLFLCIGNSCRSPMAEGFAARYGSDVMTVSSAGLSPAAIIQPLTKTVMEAKNINIDHQFPKSLQVIDPQIFDLIINMSGTKLPSRFTAEVRDWLVEDPIGRNESTYVKVRDEIENRVMLLILEFRRRERAAQPLSVPLRPAMRSQGQTTRSIKHS